MYVEVYSQVTKIEIQIIFHRFEQSLLSIVYYKPNFSFINIVFYYIEWYYFKVKQCLTKL